MDAILVVVLDVIAEQAAQMSFVDRDHVVEQLSSYGSRPSFGNPMLPRASQRSGLGVDTEVFDRLDHAA